MSENRQAASAEAIGVAAYTVTDKYFGKPYIDCDEWREAPAPHRHIHGGFEGTDTRFTFYFPPKELYKHKECKRWVSPILASFLHIFNNIAEEIRQR
jgi:hypothetical protein